MRINRERLHRLTLATLGVTAITTVIVDRRLIHPHSVTRCTQQIIQTASELLGNAHLLFGTDHVNHASGIELDLELNFPIPRIASKHLRNSSDFVW
jgi:predicted TIM-barrel fold metal-dependent hydrolase